MFNIELLRQYLLVSIIISSITCSIVQKTKVLLPNSKIIPIYSLILNIVIGIIFSYSFTTISFPKNLWIGLLSYIGADSIYRTLEGRLSTYTEQTTRRKNKKSTKTVDKTNQE